MVLDRSPSIVDVPTEMPDGIEDVAWFNATGDDFRQKRLEEEVVLAADQDDLGGIILLEQTAKPARGLNAGKPATHNDNSDWCCLSAEWGYH